MQGRVVHMQTRVETLFGLLDDDDNITPLAIRDEEGNVRAQPTVVMVQQFSADAFIEAFRAILQERDQVVQRIAEQAQEQERQAQEQEQLQEPNRQARRRQAKAKPRARKAPQRKVPVRPQPANEA